MLDHNNDTWQELLGISSEAVEKLKSLPAQYSTPLGFAIIIHNVFMRIYRNSQKTESIDANELDFCPVAILYCKVIEAMLKEKHTSNAFSICLLIQESETLLYFLR